MEASRSESLAGPSNPTIKRIFAMSHNLCAHPDCGQPNSGAIAQFNDVLTQATDLEEAPAWWVHPLDQLRADESDGGAAAKERSDNCESVHSSCACRADYRDQSSYSAQR